MDGIADNEIHWFSSYLKNRQETAKIGYTLYGYIWNKRRRIKIYIMWQQSSSFSISRWCDYII